MHIDRNQIYGLMLALARQLSDGERRDFGAFQAERNGRVVRIDSSSWPGWAYDVLASFDTVRLDGDWAYLDGAPNEHSLTIAAVR